MERNGVALCVCDKCDLSTDRVIAHLAAPEQDSDEAYLRRLVPAMRELGVTSAFGIVLGPPPPPPAAEPVTETPEARYQRKVREERERLGLLLGREPTDVEFDQLASPESLR